MSTAPASYCTAPAPAPLPHYLQDQNPRYVARAEVADALERAAELARRHLDDDPGCVYRGAVAAAAFVAAEACNRLRNSLPPLLQEPRLVPAVLALLRDAGPAGLTVSELQEAVGRRHDIRGLARYCPRWVGLALDRLVERGQVRLARRNRYVLAVA